jgi:hypothetical protein
MGAEHSSLSVENMETPRVLDAEFEVLGKLLSRNNNTKMDFAMFSKLITSRFDRMVSSITDYGE